MIDRHHLRVYVVRPVLHHLGLHSLAAESLLIGTAAQESGGGRYLEQLGGGPALGIYQMEPGTHRDIWQNFLAHRADLASRVADLCAPGLSRLEQLPANLLYATAMARVHYLRVPQSLPSAYDVPALAAYWKQHYNTPLGRGSVAEFISNWSRYA